MKKPIQIYIRFLLATFGSALVMSIYSIVDSVCVGQYHQEAGTAALAVIMPLWTMIYSCGLLFGIGGATLLSSARGRGDDSKANAYFTLSCILTAVTAAVLWGVIALGLDRFIVFFGAKTLEIYDLAQKYAFWMKVALPVFMATQLLSCFVRNDNAPLTATLAVISGGAFNIIGDIFFVFDFGLGMGISGAGLATMIGQFITVGVLLSHFLRKRNTLRFVKIKHIGRKSLQILKIGFSAFILDIAMGFLTILFNNQINRYTNNDANTLAIYGVICNIVALVQSLAYAVGQASQPLLSTSYGENNLVNIRKYNRYALITAVVIGVAAATVILCLPNPLIRLFINTSGNAEILEMAPGIIRGYFLCLPFLILNIYASYFFQSILKPNFSFIISLLRGIVLPFGLVLLFPAVFGFSAIWYAMPVSEGIVFVCMICFMIRNIRGLSRRISLENMV